MTLSRLVLAQGMVMVAFILVLLNAAGGSSIFATPRLGMILGLSAILLSAAAFLASWKDRSVVISALLVATGVLFMMPAVIATGYFKFITIPGPILGVIFGSLILALGIAKGIRRKMVVEQ